MARSENCAGAKIEHISFHQDALLFDFAKTKTDRERTKFFDHPWHVYSNYLEPVVCPVLALPRYIISNPIILDGNYNLFEGKSQYEIFNNIFNDVVKIHRNEFIVLGISPEDYGMHSIRKGAATFVTTVCTV